MNTLDRRLVAVVTGAGQNIGKACALRLASMGFDVLVHGGSNHSRCESVATEITRRFPDRRTEICIADLSSPTGCQRLIEVGIQAFGGADVLVNCVAVRPEAVYTEISLDEWSSVFQTNLIAPFLLSQAFIGGMQERQWGRIINFAGMNAIAGYHRRAHVSASKHGVVGLTKAIAREFAREGVTANVISPGPIRGQYDDPELRHHIETQIAKVPTGRLGTSEEIAGLVGYLASQEGAFCNGQLLSINGGAAT
ncbi:MAG: SDR family NAD(P)-dependent oxidoreductase [Pseudomonadota bacterium]